MPDLILAIDQGTTNSKAVLVDDQGQVVHRGAAPVPIHYPAPGWVEQDPEAIWDSVRGAVRACTDGRHDGDIVAVAISNQRESVVAWHARSGEALGPCLSWQDRRTERVCNELRAAGHSAAVRRATGLPIDPMFAATKAGWLVDDIRQRRPHVALADIRLGTVDAWLLHKATGGRVHACDASNAARTQLLDLGTVTWSDDLCALFGVPASALPTVHASDARFDDAEHLPGVPSGTPLHAMIGDSHAALFAHGVDQIGTVKATYGTGSSLMTLIDAPDAPEDGITTTIAWSRGGRAQYALEGNILVAASSLPWAAALLGMDDDVAALAALAETVETTQGVNFVPALVGLGAPYWDGEARGIISGLTFPASRPHVARAILESIPLQVTDVFDVMMRQAPVPLERLMADGGPSSNRWLMQLQADLLGVPVLPANAPEASALGAAYLAGIAMQRWASLGSIPTVARDRSVFEPRRDDAWRAERRASWAHAVAQARLRSQWPA